MMKKLLPLTLALACLMLTSCAAGSATAGYALKAQTADGLSAAAEERLIEKTKSEIYKEMGISNNARACSQN